MPQTAEREKTQEETVREETPYAALERATGLLSGRLPSRHASSTLALERPPACARVLGLWSRVVVSQCEARFEGRERQIGTFSRPQKLAPAEKSRKENTAAEVPEK